MAEFQTSCHLPPGEIYSQNIPCEPLGWLGDRCVLHPGLCCTPASPRPHFRPKGQPPTHTSSAPRSFLRAMTFLSLAVIEFWSYWLLPSPSPSPFSLTSGFQIIYKLFGGGSAYNQVLQYMLLM